MKTDTDMTDIIVEKVRGSVKTVLLDWWENQTEHNETLAMERWNSAGKSNTKQIFTKERNNKNLYYRYLQEQVSSITYKHLV